MIVVDSSAVIHAINARRHLPRDNLYVPDDLQDEYEVMAFRHGKHKLPNVSPASEYPGYDEVHFVQRYAYYLNRYSKVYLARMSGLADVSILALVDCMVNNFGNVQQLTLDLGGSNPELVTVITDDDDLKKFLETEFGDKVSVLTSDDL